MFKKALIALAFVGLLAGVVRAAGTPVYTSAAGTAVLSSTKATVERIYIVKSTGSAIVSIYNATSTTGAVAGNLVAALTVTAATANLEIPLFGTFTQGVVVSTAGNANTVTAFATVAPLY